MRRREPAVSLRCDDGDRGCGIIFLAGARHARKIREGLHPQLCSRCSHASLRRKPRDAPGPADFVFWLELFSDDELAELCSYAFGVGDRTVEIAARRQELLTVPESRTLAAAGGRR